MRNPICPENSTVDIFTDSQCAIQGIEGWLSKGKKWNKFNNNLLLFKIGILIREKQIKLALHKVKGHSGDFWNDEVDEPIFTYSEMTSHMVIPEFNGCRIMINSQLNKIPGNF